MEDVTLSYERLLVLDTVLGTVCGALDAVGEYNEEYRTDEGHAAYRGLDTAVDHLAKLRDAAVCDLQHWINISF